MEEQQQDKMPAKTVSNILEAICIGRDDTVGGALDKLDASAMSHMALFVRRTDGLPLGCVLFVSQPELAQRIEATVQKWEEEQDAEYLPEEE